MLLRYFSFLVVNLIWLLSVNSAIAVPINDDWIGATEISFPLPFNDSLITHDATSDPIIDTNACAPVGRTIWYSFTPPLGMTITVNTFGSDFDTVLAAYTNSGGSFTEFACNDDTDTTQSQISFFASAHQTIFFMVGGFQGYSGNLRFTLTSDVTDFCPEDDYATYSPMMGTLKIPFVNIPLLDPETLLPNGEMSVFKVELKLQGIFPLESDFSIRKLEAVSESPNELCHATYSYEDKILRIPFVRVPSVGGWPFFEEVEPVSILEIKLKYSQSSPLKIGVLRVQEYAYLDMVGENSDLIAFSQKLIDKNNGQ